MACVVFPLVPTSEQGEYVGKYFNSEISESTKFALSKMHVKVKVNSEPEQHTNMLGSTSILMKVAIAGEEVSLEIITGIWKLFLELFLEYAWKLFMEFGNYFWKYFWNLDLNFTENWKINVSSCN